MKVTVESHDPAWRAAFENIHERLKIILKDVIHDSIEHVGSTSIPGLPAKPVLDIDIIVPESSVQPARDAMSAAGYLDCGDLGVPGRYVLREPGFSQSQIAHDRADGKPRQNTYVIVRGCTSLRNHLDVKRVLLEDELLRREYGEVKLRLAEAEYDDIDDYVAGKTAVLVKILRKAGWSEQELAPVVQINTR